MAEFILKDQHGKEKTFDHDKIFVMGTDGELIQFTEGTGDAPAVVQPLEVTENGTYTAPDGVDGYSPVTVAVPEPEINLQDKTITENGTYTADSGYDGLGSVTVVVAGSGASPDLRYVTFMSYDGLMEYGKKAVAVGDDCADPIARGVFSTPTRESNAQYNYTFYGWATTPNGAADSTWNKAITEDKTVYANFASSVRYYTITYYDSDGTTVLKTESLAYGAMPSSTYVPEKDGHAFIEWQPSLSVVTGAAIYTAQWQEALDFAHTSWAKIAGKSADGTASSLWKVGDSKTIVYKNTDGTEIEFSVKIIGFNHDDLADGSGKAGITFSCLSNSLPDSIYGAYYSAITGGAPYNQSTIKTLLENTIKKALPAELQSVLKLVKKEIDKYAYEKTGHLDLETTNVHLFPFSLGEIGLLTTSNASYLCLGTKYAGLTTHSSTWNGVWTRNHQHQKGSQSCPAYLYYSSNKTAYQSIGESSFASTSKKVKFGFCI